MTVIDTCPDTLSARARGARLSASERTQLREHLSRCGTCRVIYLVGQDFDRMLATRPEDPRLIGRIIDAVRPVTIRSRWRARHRTAFVGLVAALLTVYAVAVAGRARMGLVWAALVTRGSNPIPVEKAPLAPKTERASSPTIAREVATTNAPLSPRSRVVVTHAKPVPSVSANAVEPLQSTAKELFAEANAARRNGDILSTRRLYADLQTRYAWSAEAQVSRVALGRLLLERGHDVSVALAQFDDFLAHGSRTGLAEEALFGRATALEQLDRPEQERQTWQTLLDRFPGSIYAERARARLRNLQ
jgi:TolA-binding protein